MLIRETNVSFEFHVLLIYEWKVKTNLNIRNILVYMYIENANDEQISGRILTFLTTLIFWL